MGCEATEIGDKLANITNAVHACSIESFHGEASCRISDHRQSIGLPIYVPQRLGSTDTFEISRTLGLHGDCTVAFEFESSRAQHPKAGVRLNIFDSGAGDSCLHKCCPYIQPGSYRANTTIVQTANGTVTPPWRADAIIPIMCSGGYVKNCASATASSWTHASITLSPLVVLP